MKRLPKICLQRRDPHGRVVEVGPLRTRTAFTFRMWADGCQQWMCMGNGSELALERVLRPNSRRVRWCLVDRTGITGHELYPPKVAGPFKNFAVAYVAFQLLQE